MPTSYRAPNRSDADAGRSASQSTDSNLPLANAKVKDILSSKGQNVITISPEDTLGQAVELLRDHRIGALVVTESHGDLCGIISERDIVRKLADTPGRTLPQQVQEVMTHDVKTCAAGAPLVSVLKIMTEGRFRHMPVIENETLAGMITIGDVVNYRLVQLEHEALQLKQLIVG
ncbi:MAG: CBS domain-containing protein [Rhodobacterales bacterium]|nr:MAG: CBS domain-containing protein [Rhodobacterales bacterium]